MWCVSDSFLPVSIRVGFFVRYCCDETPFLRLYFGYIVCGLALFFVICAMVGLIRGLYVNVWFLFCFSFFLSVCTWCFVLWGGFVALVFGCFDCILAFLVWCCFYLILYVIFAVWVFRLCFVRGILFLGWGISIQFALCAGSVLFLKVNLGYLGFRCLSKCCLVFCGCYGYQILSWGILLFWVALC